jgi:transposase
VIDKNTFWNMKWDYETLGLTIPQLSEKYSFSPNTVRHWLKQDDFTRRKPRKVESNLESYREMVRLWLNRTPSLTSMQLHRLLAEAGYEGSYSTVRRLVAKIRPKRPKAFMRLHFDPGDAVQVDFGACGYIPCGTTRRRLSALVMTLCHSRLMYVEFILSERQEHFLSCLQNGFHYFAGVTGRVIVDNCKCAVTSHMTGEQAVFNSRFLDFAGHYGFRPVACNPYSPHEKGIVENAVGYLKKSFMPGRRFGSLAEAQTALLHWLNSVANVRTHGTTGRTPIDLFREKEKSLLKELNSNRFDCSVLESRRADNRCRVWFDSNAYSVPSRCAGKSVTVSADPNHVRIYSESAMVALHTRSYDRKTEVIDPEHIKDIRRERQAAREQNLVRDFLRIGHAAAPFLEGLKLKQLNYRPHLRKIIALAETFGREIVNETMETAVEFQSFRSEYIENLLAQKCRKDIVPTGILHVPKAGDLLHLRLQQPDIENYDI